MKKLCFLLALIAVTFGATAQTFNSLPKIPASFSSPARGNYGTIVPIGYVQGTQCTIVTGTVTPVSGSHPDTLKAPTTGIIGYGTDSGYVQFAYHNKVDKTFELLVSTLTGTLAGTAVLQGSFDNATWYTITGNTTYCASCKGASATLSGAGTSNYQWYVPDVAENYPYHQVAVYMTGTCTATYSVTCTASF